MYFQDTYFNVELNKDTFAVQMALLFLTYYPIEWIILKIIRTD